MLQFVAPTGFAKDVPSTQSGASSTNELTEELTESSTNESDAQSVDTIPPKIPNIKTLPGPNSKQKLEYAEKYIISGILPQVARVVVGLTTTFSVIFLIFGAIQLLTAYGSEEKLGNAKKAVTFAIVGLAISLLAFAIVQIVFFTGFHITKI